MSDADARESSAPLEYPEIPAELARAKGLKLLKYFGPGAIVASLTIGSGETVFASRGGAVFGFSLLWLFLIAAIAKGLQVYTGSRHITLTGEHPLKSWNRIPALRGWFPFLMALITILCFPFWVAGLPKMLGTLINWMVGIAPDPDPEHYGLMVKVWGTLFIGVGVTVTFLQTYKFLERVQAVIVGILLVSLLAAAIASRPDLIELLTGTFIPAMPHYPEWALTKYPKDFGQRPIMHEIAVYVGAMGGGTLDYFGYVGILREKKWGMMERFRAWNPEYSPGQVPLPTDPEQVLRGRGWLRPACVDVGVAFACVIIFTFTFVILGAQILHPREIAPSGAGLLTEQKDFLMQVHESLKYFYQAGVFMAFFGTILAVFEVYTRSAHECVIAVVPALKRCPISRVRVAIVAYCSVGALYLMWSNADPVDIVTPAAILGSVLTCGLWCFASAWADRKQLPKEYQMGPVLFWGVIVSGFLLTGLGTAAAWQYFGERYFGL